MSTPSIHNQRQPIEAFTCQQHTIADQNSLLAHLCCVVAIREFQNAEERLTSPAGGQLVNIQQLRYAEVGYLLIVFGAPMPASISASLEI